MYANEFRLKQRLVLGGLEEAQQARDLHVWPDGAAHPDAPEAELTPMIPAPPTPQGEVRRGLKRCAVLEACAATYAYLAEVDVLVAVLFFGLEARGVVCLRPGRESPQAVRLRLSWRRRPHLGRRMACGLGFHLSAELGAFCAGGGALIAIAVDDSRA